MPDELQLLERVSDACQHLPGALELYLFGSTADPARCDSYSDLDLQVVTGNLPASLCYWPAVLGLAGRVTLIWPLTGGADNTAFSITMAGECLYHKVDIGLSACGGKLPFASSEPHRLLWGQAANFTPVELPCCPAYTPAFGSIEHLLVGELLSAVRYAKARLRGQTITCWRFLSAKVEFLLRAYLWSGAGQPFPGALSTHDYIDLDQRLGPAERDLILGNLDLSTPAAMDMALLDITRKLVERVCPRYCASKESLAVLTREYLAFVAAELSVIL